MDSIKQNVKAILGIDDDLQDQVITILINNTQSHLKLWLKKHAGLDEIPAELTFIIEEMTINRFQKLGSEGMKSEAIEGRSVTYREDDFKSYLSILEPYIPKQDGSGKVMFF
ncbi:phage head-tail connector protein [Halobacillus sp. HZG1]|uniref:phage head-tail connector protein n=1 Tax=Halobacillus sp. HZG1 TaxID=3111769 RepID=UPI002DBF2726|nr:phage head-tail connector protein [Halobacillus sp. HZG1]MEC3884586.1 phage head-tail connector protein [Halobacillus sp. HZG1]